MMLQNSMSPVVQAQHTQICDCINISRHLSYYQRVEVQLT